MSGLSREDSLEKMIAVVLISSSGLGHCPHLAESSDWQRQLFEARITEHRLSHACAPRCGPEAERRKAIIFAAAARNF